MKIFRGLIGSVVALIVLFALVFIGSYIPNEQKGLQFIAFIMGAACGFFGIAGSIIYGIVLSYEDIRIAIKQYLKYGKSVEPHKVHSDLPLWEKGKKITYLADEYGADVNSIRHGEFIKATRNYIVVEIPFIDRNNGEDKYLKLLPWQVISEDKKKLTYQLPEDQSYQKWLEQRKEFLLEKDNALKELD